MTDMEAGSQQFRGFEKVYTTAPDVYDHGEAEQVGVLGTAVDGKQIREVMVPVGVLEWQIGRYKSGLYLGTTDRSDAERTLQ